MIVVAIIGILAAVAIPAFIKYIRRSKTTEAAMNVRKMFDSTVSYYEAEHASANGAILDKQFADAAGLDPRPGHLLQPDRPEVRARRHALADPDLAGDQLRRRRSRHYSYAVNAGAGTGSNPGDFQQLDASGDLNCNGIYSLYRRTATVLPGRTISGGSGLYTQNDIE